MHAFRRRPRNSDVTGFPSGSSANPCWRGGSEPPSLTDLPTETLFEHAGEMEDPHRLEDHFYSSVLADPLLQPLFGAGKPKTSIT